MSSMAYFILMVALSTFKSCVLDQTGAAVKSSTNQAVAAIDDSSKGPSPSPVDFKGHLQPILRAKCQPCHFAGGKMYAKLPFDDPATVRSLGVKLFTRIKDANQQALFRAFFATKSGTATDVTQQQ